MPSELGVKLTTRAVWSLMRMFSAPTLRHAREKGWLAILDAVLARAQLQTLGGVGVNLRLSGRYFPYWGAQAFGVLSGEHELMVQEALRRTLPHGGVMIDVGSNIGATTLLGARLVGPNGRVLALDPQRECALATRVNAALNHFEHVTVINAAAAGSTGRAELIVTADALWTRLATVGEHPLERRRDRVAAIALDQLAAQEKLSRVDVVKIDVEGAELDVIAGMERMLSTMRPVVVCEMHGHNAAFCGAMRERGYRVINLDGPEPVERASDNVHAFCEPV